MAKTEVKIESRFEALLKQYPEVMAHAVPPSEGYPGVFFLTEERKYAVQIKCADCGEIRIVRTSDLQWRNSMFCLVCAKGHKKSKTKGDSATPNARLVNGKLIIDLPANLKKAEAPAEPEKGADVEDEDAMVAQEPESLT